MSTRSANVREARPEVLAFLQDIKEHPYDETPRLILADWLEEQGDPRSEFLRLQLARRRLRSGGASWHELLQQERQLLSEHGEDWLGPLFDLVQKYAFEGGLLHLCIHFDALLAADPARLEALEAWAWVEKLEIFGVTAARVSQLTDWPLFPQIGNLDLTGNHLGSAGVQALASPQAGHLRVLDLGDNRLHAAGARVLADSPHLRRLHVLGLYHNTIGDEGAAALATSHHLNQLTDLWLGFNGIGDAGALALANTRYLPCLNELTLCDNHVSGEGVLALRRRYGAGVFL
jgi:uncharacterized protein (TIGR02996 family)